MPEETPVIVFIDAEYWDKLPKTRQDLSFLQGMCDDLLDVCKNEEDYQYYRDRHRILKCIDKNQEAVEAAGRPYQPIGFVYLCRNNRNGYTKIGYSKSPTFREVVLQSQEPEVEMIWTTPGDRKLESKLHAIFSSNRLRGEWFDLTKDDIDFITGGFYAPEVS